MVHPVLRPVMLAKCSSIPAKTSKAQFFLIRRKKIKTFSHESVGFSIFWSWLLMFSLNNLNIQIPRSCIFRLKRKREFNKRCSLLLKYSPSQAKSYLWTAAAIFSSSSISSFKAMVLIHFSSYCMDNRFYYFSNYYIL